ncbi:hypothetical protein MJO28_002950 [Puccinia striiformis f. sp. tritici]|uniref:Kynurenine 3-monooxygenase n=4 Tax=Puccinia striiformis TaxID=27350 RepID=A0A0L0VJ80_9BASI|nr:hypothetical protein Pst134EA_005111 [Puccinia striiformis f. sp. tritici]KAI9629484.1 hypothetical protein KEM48_012953 [Puccinia striiformis f. sp. tritici PST-130]KNE99340.1 hypothetical protein PSTG_07457 [Puccinia striiformis f. sp. tritici PST-78]POW09837.1 hypothetical protein PSTT_06529 [Puccinia striiformis]KAH9462263.1 hypothetical protein Pst134EB_006169 [Puccinia striiformis f. sp. tritici]KAH9471202.1 hypothetical protein Pst134EA_005111 [Puccinia striiformis f. sp. tritici]
MSEKPSVVVVGAGPVGCLAACMMENHGWSVDLFEARSDFRKPQTTVTRPRSINLAFSKRGIEAIRAVDPEMVERLLLQVTPMKGRMIHGIDGALNSQPYGLHEECINSIDRNLLNQSILTEAEQRPNVTVHFNKKLIKSKFDDSILIFQDTNTQETLEIKSDLTIGADGSYSQVRQQIMRSTRVDFSQEYIDDLYLELSIPPGIDKDTGKPCFLLDPTHLHIWPRQSFMLIALPNQDKSFTCTLFAPYKGVFDHLKVPTNKEEEQHILDFFKSNFGDALSLIGEQDLLRCFIENPRGSLLTIKCKPYHYKDKAVIIGDAAHSMVPFYGQGMNCGLEDVRKLDQLLIKYSGSIGEEEKDNQAIRQKENLHKILERYTETRHQDLLAICDLALQNYREMSDKVTRFDYLVRKKVDGLLARILRGNWLPLYTMVTFRDDIDYSQVIKREAKQSQLIDWSLRFFVGCSSVGLIATLFKFARQFKSSLLSD